MGSIAAGPVWANAGETQTFYMAPNIVKTWLLVKYLLEYNNRSLRQWLRQWGLVVVTIGKASLGVGFNRAASYTNTPLIFPAVRTPDFTNHTKTAFSWTVGAGAQVPVNDHWQLGAGRLWVC